jgi:hypothetical protein
VQVRVVRVDMERARIDFVLAGEDESQGSRNPVKRGPGARRSR